MRIAYISYEYPPDISAGGIATYTYQAAKVMKLRGHDVEVFCGSFERDISEIYDSVLTHRIKIKDVFDFRNRVVEVFKLRNDFKTFDIIESPEINANGLNIKKEFLQIPLVVKLHTPAVLQIRIFNTYTPFLTKLRFVLGSIRRGKLDWGYWSKHDKNQSNDVDYQICQMAQRISSPSIALKNWAIDFWKLDPSKIDVIPYPYIPDKQLLNIPIENDFKQILFYGKLNVHKGMVEFAKVIPIILKKYPDYRFLIVGKNGPSHIRNKSMKQYMIEKIGKFIDKVKFVETIPLNEIHNILRQSDIVVIPSIWDNFPLVCMEAMSAARAIVASREGGMFDMLYETNAGILVNPKKKFEIVKAISFFIENKQMKFLYGQRARKRIVDEYNADKIGKMMEEFYYKVINNK